MFANVEVLETGEDGEAPQYTAESILEFSDRNAPAITYIQNTIGPLVLITPEELPAELERVDNNSRAIFNATTSTEMIMLGGQQATVHISKSDAEQIMTIFVPVDDGALLAPVVLGIYAKVAGCEETMSEVFDALKSGVALNAQTTYHDLEKIQQARQEKLDMN